MKDNSIERVQEALRAELAEVDVTITRHETQMYYFEIQLSAAKEYRSRLARMLVVLCGEELGETPTTTQKVLREQALRARLGKTDMSDESRLATLQEAARVFGLDAEYSAEVRELLAKTKPAKPNSRRARGKVKEENDDH